MNTKLHAVADTVGRPIRFVMTAGQVCDYKGAAALIDQLPKAEFLLAPSRDHAAHNPVGQWIGGMMLIGSVRHCRIKILSPVF